MDDVKGLLVSKTFWGIVVTLIGALGPKFGFSIDEVTGSGLADAIVTLIGAALALYGRIRAVKRIRGVV